MSSRDKKELLARTMGLEAVYVLQHAAMRCGGCGSKVGASVLNRALKNIKHLVAKRIEVVAGLGVTSGMQ